MLKNRAPNQYWVEPFVGGGNMIESVPGLRIGSDSNRWCIEGLISVRDHVHELPKNNLEFTEDDYAKLRSSDNYKHKGFAGFSYSYGAVWLSSYRRDSEGKRDYVNESFKAALKQSPKLQDVTLLNTDYKNLNIPKNSLIYCDPPYRNTASYKNIEPFNYEYFYNWCRDRAKEGHIVFVSEYWMPDDFECIWFKEINSSLTKNTGAKKGVEKLFKLN